MMTELLRKLAVVWGLLCASSSSWAAIKDPNVPEPGSLALVGIALAAAVYFGTRKKK